MPIFNVIIPANAAICFDLIMQVVAFDLIPPDLTIAKWLNLEDTGAYSIAFEIMGLESMFCILNMTSFSLILLAALALVILNKLLGLCKKKVMIIYRVHRAISRKFVYRYFLRLMHEVFLIALLCAVINFYYLRLETIG